MLFMTDSIPEYCPGCRALLHVDTGTLEMRQMARADFFNGASFSCRECGARFCFCYTDKILEVADELGSDLRANHERGI